MAAVLAPRGDASGHLAGLLGCTATEIVIHRGRNGKPLLSSPRGAAYSVAHRAGLSLIAAGRCRAIGVDLELVRSDLPLADIADTCFGAAEASWLHGLAADRLPLAFTLVWAIKEAVLKSDGSGIAAGMIDPAIPTADLAPLLAGAATLALRLPGLGRVQVRQGTLGSGHAVACVATASPDRLSFDRDGIRPDNGTDYLR